MICFPFVFIILNLKLKRATHFSHSGIKEPFSEVALQTRESLKRPYFPLPLSILAGTNLITLLFYFFATPVWFPRKSIPHLISGKIHPRFSSTIPHKQSSCKHKNLRYNKKKFPNILNHRVVNNAKQPSAPIFSQEPNESLNGKLTCD